MDMRWTQNRTLQIPPATRNSVADPSWPGVEKLDGVSLFSCTFFMLYEPFHQRHHHKLNYIHGRIKRFMVSRSKGTLLRFYCDISTIHGRPSLAWGQNEPPCWRHSAVIPLHD